MTILCKNTADQRFYNISCMKRLAANETITNVISVSDVNSVLTYGHPVVNTAPVTLPNGVIAPIGTVIQVEISGGSIPPNSKSYPTGVPNFAVQVIAEFTTSLGQQIAIPSILLLQDQATH